MSAFAPPADIAHIPADVCRVPIAEVHTQTDEKQRELDPAPSLNGLLRGLLRRY
jgi:hypothetical protein